MSGCWYAPLLRDPPGCRQSGGALLAIREDGTYQTIYRKWFGSDEHAFGDHH